MKFRKPLGSPDQSRATTNWKEAVQLERDVIEQARNGALTPKAGPSRLFAACDAYLAAKRVTANRERTVAFDEERLAIVKTASATYYCRPSRARWSKTSKPSGNSMGSATARSTWTWARCARS